MTPPARTLKAVIVATTLGCLVGCVSIYVAPPPAQFAVLETDVEMARRAMAEMRSIGTAVEEYSIDSNRYPVSSQSGRLVDEFRLDPVRSLAGVLKPYIKFIPKEDPWHKPYLYWSNGQAYTVICTGADGDVTDSVGLAAC